MKTRSIIFFCLLFLTVIASSIADDGGDSGFNWWDWFNTGTAPPGIINLPPTINGDPPTTVNVGQYYSFTPTASDPEGSPLTFSITNLPNWASFNQLDGTLSGTPSNTDVGLYDAIQISVFDGLNTASLGPINITVNTALPDLAPSISGDPAFEVNAGQLYSFTPTASDPEGSLLTFNITNLPGWANFNLSDGTLSGIPSSADVGLYEGIVITVFDGTNSASLGPISIRVNGTGSATLSWAIPSARTDGTSLSMSEIDGYKIYMGESNTQLDLIMDLNKSTTTTYTVTDLASGTYYFSVTTYDIQGNESAFSNIADKTIL